MSTILDALRKVERERDESPDHALEPQPLAPEVRRRRNGPLTAIALCAVLGFAGGAFLSWWTPAEEPAVEVAALPVPPPPPAIAVPRPPVAEPAIAPAVAPAAEAAVPAADAPAASAPGAVPAPAVVALDKPAQQPGSNAPAPAAVAAVPANPPAESKEALASVGKDATALEPSPFAGQRNAVREVTTPPAVQMDPGNKPAAVEVNKAERELAAVEPTEPAIPEPAPIDVAPEAQAEPEPETPAETMVDTGRSPPGAPKVALSFLQWSADPERRFAFVSIDGQPSQRVREGESTAGMTVAAITPTGVQFKRDGTSFVIRPRH